MNYILDYTESNVKQRKREQILKHSMDAFVRDGIHALTMKDIAKECDISLRSLYYYYSCMDDLAVDVMIIAMTEFGDFFDTTFHDEMSGYDNMVLFLQNMAHQMLHNQDAIKYITAFDFHYFKEYPNKKYNKFLNTFKMSSNMFKILDKAMSDGSINFYDEEPTLFFATILQSILAYTQKVLYREHVMQSEDINAIGSLNMIIDFYIKALKA